MAILMLAFLNSVLSCIMLYSADEWLSIYRVNIEVLNEPLFDSLLNTP